MRKRFVPHAAVAAALAVAALAGLAASGRALECPEAQPAAQPGVITEAPAQIAELAPVLAGGDLILEVPKIVEALRRRYPTAGSDEITNYLITAYCPGVANLTGLNDAEKTARVRAFSKAVLSVLY